MTLYNFALFEKWTQNVEDPNDVQNYNYVYMAPRQSRFNGHYEWTFLTFYNFIASIGISFISTIHT